MFRGPLAHLAYASVVVLLWTVVPGHALTVSQHAGGTLFVLGVLGTWRYGWALTNFVRGSIFLWIVHPRRKAQRQAVFAARGIPCHAYFMVTTYMVAPQDTLACYRALFRAAVRAPDGATIVASVVDGADERLIRQIFDTFPEDLSRITLRIDRIPSKGKRDAIARSLQLIAAEAPTRHDIVVFVDGDTCVPETIVEESAPVFTDPKIGALTTDEGVILHKDNLFKDWFILRFNQRQAMMCSMGLSNKVLTLTGRMSVFRADLTVTPGFIEGVRHDFIDHWRLGRVTFLTGDDKSTWYWLLSNGYEMVYLPDVRSWSMETQPRPSFFESSQVLMTRWFGNMMRTNGRALGLGPQRIGFFTWWSILDQRVSAWTTLVGPLSVILAAVFQTSSVIPLYVAWVMLTRYIQCAIVSLFRGTWFPITHPPILYFSQVVGAAVKTSVMFRLNKQKWTRQGGSSGAAKVSLQERLLARDSSLHHALALGWLTIGVIVLALA